MKRLPPLLAVLLGILPFAAAGAGATDDTGLLQVTAVIDVRSTVSDGDHDFDQLAALARQHGIEAIFVSDHDRLVLEYGLFPFRKIVKKREERPSVATVGAGEYLRRVRAAGERWPDVLFIPGVEAAPFYYWTGLPLVGDGLVAHQWERHLLVFGLDAEGLAGLPVLHNDHGSLRIDRQPPFLILFVLTGLIGVVALGWGGRFRLAGLLLLLFSLLLGQNDLRPGVSRFDQYHGEQGAAPWQECIDRVAAGGGLSFWNHPETNSGRRPLGPIRLDTPSYPEMLERNTGYTGFAAIYGDRTTTTEPGGLWDGLLLQYCRGERQRPPTAIAVADFHREGKDGEVLGNFATVLLAREKSGRALLDALSAGRAYALRGHGRDRDLLREFSVTAADGATAAIGGRLAVADSTPALIRAMVDHGGGDPHPIRLRLIRNGEVIAETDGVTPFRWQVTDRQRPPGAGFYRLEATGPRTRILANPVFVVPDD
ncbi:MAG: hypothetical protein AB1568_11895 [Thermodesulfobacteriota bacterium]